MEDTVNREVEESLPCDTKNGLENNSEVSSSINVCIKKDSLENVCSKLLEGLVDQTEKEEDKPIESTENENTLSEEVSTIEEIQPSLSSLHIKICDELADIKQLKESDIGCQEESSHFETVQLPKKKLLNESPVKSKPKVSSSVFEYLYGELRRGYYLENDEQRFAERREKFYIFFTIPVEIEKFIIYGFFQCVDAFLFLFTFLPLRSALSIWFLITRSLKYITRTIFSSSQSNSSGVSRILQTAEICDLLKCIILLSVSFIMTYIDTSMMYHIVKSQSVIKLYIMFNMLEVADKLFSSFGQDILDALYWTATEPRGRKREHIGLLPHLIMSIAYVFCHSVIVLFQATTLNVAINSQNKALLTIMLSNNFVELKSMVFKKFEKSNLFQMSCSDVRERFHYLILLFIVIIQTMKEYNWSYEHFMVLLPYCIGVFAAEILVDWTKHAFITKFNEISSEVYKNYRVSLAYDLASCKLKNAFSDHSDLISRRMGFIPLPLGALVLRVVIGSIPVVGFLGITSFFLLYLCLVSAKIWISIILLGRACLEIEAHRLSEKEKLPHPRQCNSLPSSRHHSSEDLQNIRTKATKSVPQSPSASVSSSLADIAAHVEIQQESMENSQLFSNSTVSLNSLGMNDNFFNNEQLPLDKFEPGERWKTSTTFGGSLRPTNEPLKRRISLQEKISSDDTKS